MRVDLVGLPVLVIKVAVVAHELAQELRKVVWASVRD